MLEKLQYKNIKKYKTYIPFDINTNSKLFFDKDLIHKIPFVKERGLDNLLKYLGELNLKELVEIRKLIYYEDLIVGYSMKNYKGYKSLRKFRYRKLDLKKEDCLKIIKSVEVLSENKISFFDSHLGNILLNPKTKDIKICDVGSGAGFPGIVLKIFFPNINITLIDSLNKRIIYLNDIINKLGLTNIEALHYRMEDFSKIHEEEYDFITARAVSQLPVLCEICVKALKINGSLVFRRASCGEEVLEIEGKVSKLGLKLDEVNRFVLPIENSNRSIISIEKYCKTNKLYPRTIDKIKKNPL